MTATDFPQDIPDMTTAASITNIAGILLTVPGVEAPSPSSDTTDQSSFKDYGFIMFIVLIASVGLCLLVLLICLARAKLQAVYKKFKTAKIHPQTSDVELGRA